MTAFILQTKLLTPRPPANYVVRDGLLRRLDRVLEKKLTLVAAPAGFGKTTLVAAWLAQFEERVAWVALDGRDSDPTTFLSYVVEAFGRLRPGQGNGARAMLQSGQVPPVAVLSALANDALQAVEPHVLVLDDYHLIESDVIDDALALWLEHFPPSLHLVIITRKTPNLPLARMRVRGEFEEISAETLRFTNDESKQFLRETMALTVTDETAQSVAERTEGWVAGLQLAALSLRENRSQTVSGSQRFVQEYLFDEVFNHQSEAVQRFLLETAVLEQLSAPLCDAVTLRSDSGAVLRRLETANLFVVGLDDEARAYRFHHLFGEFLRRQLDGSGIDLGALHGRAGAWFAAQGNMQQAVAHGLAGQQFEQVATWIAAAADDLWTRGQVRQLQSWIAALPAGVVENRPILALYRVWTAFFIDPTERLTPLLDAVRQPLSQHEEGMLNAIRCAVSGAKGDAQTAIAAGDRALKLLEAGNEAWRSVVGLSVGAALMLLGEYGRAISMYQTAARQAVNGGNLYGGLYGYGMVAMMQIQSGQIEAATQTYEDAMRLIRSRQIEQLPFAGSIFAGYGELRLAGGDFSAETETLLVNGLHLTEMGGFARAETYEALAMLRERQGQLDDVIRLREKAAAVVPPPLAYESQITEPETQSTPVAVQLLPEPLSERELEILRLVGKGLSNKGVSAELHITAGTVKWHLNNVYGKLAVRSRTQAVAKARELALIP